MTRSEMQKHLDPNDFVPFVITMNNGEKFAVNHAELAMLTASDTLYIFDYAPGEKGITELQKIARIHNICTIEKEIDSAA